MPKRKSVIDAFMAMPDAEKDAIAAEFENGIHESEFRQLNAREQKLWAKAMRRIRRRSRAKLTRFTVTIENRLLKKADRHAKLHYLTRSELIAIGLKLAME